MFVNLSKHVLCCALIIVGTLAVYAEVGSHGYMILDDNRYVYDNPKVLGGLTLDGVRWAFTTFFASNWHPLTWLSHMLDVTLFGPDPGAQHWMNVALHTINGVLIYWVSVVLLNHRAASLFAALLFAVHPLHVESVAWISERKDLLCGTFYILSVISYLSFVRKPGAFRYLVVTLTLTLALLAKPMAVSLPVVFVLLDWLAIGRFRFETRDALIFFRVLLEKIPFVLITLASMAVTIMAQQGAIATVDHLPLSFRVMNAVAALVTYLRDMLIPVELIPFYPLEPVRFWRTFLPSCGVLVVTTVIAIFFRTRFPWLLFGWIWFLVTLLPVIGLVQVGTQSHADRYMYIPSIGLLIAVAAMVARLSISRQNLGYLLLCPVVAFYSFLGWIQVGYWSSQHTLWSRALEISGDSGPAHMGLFQYFVDLGQYPAAEIHAQKLVALYPNSERGFFAMGLVRAHQGQFTDAERMFSEALSLNPENPMTINNLAFVLEQQGRLREAHDLYVRAAAIGPGLKTARENLQRLQGRESSDFHR